MCYDRNKHPVKGGHFYVMLMDYGLSFTLLLNPPYFFEDILHTLHIFYNICSVPGVEKTNVQLR